MEVKVLVEGYWLEYNHKRIHERKCRKLSKSYMVNKIGSGKR
jgi:hypothetical protein